MDKIPVKIHRLLKKYLEELEKNNVPIRQAILFGSHAMDSSNEWSDIDIALISDLFEGIRIKDKDKIRRITLSVSSSLEILPFRPDDFSSENPLAKEIIETGIRLV